MTVYSKFFRCFLVFLVLQSLSVRAGGFGGSITRSTIEEFTKSPATQAELTRRLTTSSELNTPITDNVFRVYPIHSAVYQGAGAVAKIIRQGAFTNSQDNFQQTALHLAVQQGDIELVTLLLKTEEKSAVKPRSVDVLDQSYRTPLMLAIEKGKTPIARKIIEANPDFYTKDNLGKNALHFAVGYRNLEISRLLLEKDAAPRSSDELGLLPMHVLFAVHNSSDTGELIAQFVMLFFVEFSQNIDAKNKSGTIVPRNEIANSKYPEVQEIYRRLQLPATDKDALYLARDTNLLMSDIEKGETPSALNLLHGGRPNINAIDKNGFSPLINAVNNNHLFVVLSLLNLPGLAIDVKAPITGATPLLMAASHPTFKPVVERLVSLGASVEEPDNFGRTPLMHAATGDIASLLLNATAQVNARDSYGNTPLHHALKQVNINDSLVQVLLEAGAEVGRANNQGQTPIDIFNDKFKTARFSEKFTVIKDALSSASGKNDANSDNLDDMDLFVDRPPLHDACFRNDIDDIRSLLAKNPAYKYVQDKDGKTALHIAVQQNYAEILELFLENHDPLLWGKVDNQGWNAFHYAIAHRHLLMAKMLDEVGVDIYAQTKTDGNALHLALRAGDEEITDYLLSQFVDVHAKNANEEKPLDIARANGSLSQTVRVLEHQETIIQKLFNAARHNDTQYLEEFCQSRRDEHDDLFVANILRAVRNAQGESLAKVATNNKSVDVLVVLAMNGAEFYQHGDDEELETLLFKKFNEHVQQEKSRRKKAHDFLFEAYGRGLEALKDAVSNIDNKVDLNHRNKSGKTLLHIAVLDKNFDAAKLLIAHGADIYAQDETKKSILMHMVFKREYQPFIQTVFEPRHKEIQALFATVAKGTLSFDERDEFAKKLTPENVDARNSDGKTLLMVAAEQGYVDIMKLLIEYQADVYAKDYHGISVSDWVYNSGNEEAFALTPMMSAHQVTTDLYNKQYEKAGFLNNLKNELEKIRKATLQHRAKNRAQKIMR
jgi:ankyrin repeat protein